MFIAFFPTFSIHLHPFFPVAPNAPPQEGGHHQLGSLRAVARGAEPPGRRDPGEAAARGTGGAGAGDGDGGGATGGG